MMMTKEGTNTEKKVTSHAFGLSLLIKYLKVLTSYSDDPVAAKNERKKKNARKSKRETK